MQQSLTDISVPERNTADAKCAHQKSDIQQRLLASKAADSELINHGFMDFGNAEDGSASEAISEDMMAAMFEFTPLRAGLSFSNGKFGRKEMEEVLKQVNAAIQN